MDTEVKSEKKKRRVPQFLITKILPLVLVATIGAAGMYLLVSKNPSVMGITTNSEADSAKEVEALVNEVNKIMTLPTDESPTIATVSDAEKIKAQSFFKNAQNGDKLLVYTKGRKAILYRPSDKRIIDVGVININQPQANATTSGSQQNITPATKTYRIALYNGTTTVGATKEVEGAVKAVFQDAQFVERSVAALTDYAETIVVDLNGNRGDDAKKIAEALRVSLSALPDGEEKPENADFLIIVGGQ